MAGEQQTLKPLETSKFYPPAARARCTHPLLVERCVHVHRACLVRSIRIVDCAHQLLPGKWYLHDRIAAGQSSPPSSHRRRRRRGLTNDGRAAPAALQTSKNDGKRPNSCFFNARN